MKACAENSKILNDKLKPLVVFMGVLILISGIYQVDFIEISIGLIMLLLRTFNKNTLITEDGLETKYQFAFFNHKEKTGFKEMTNIRIEMKNEQIALHFIKGVTGKRVILESNKVEDIIDMARRKNNKLIIDEI